MAMKNNTLSMKGWCKVYMLQPLKMLSSIHVTITLWSLPYPQPMSACFIRFDIKLIFYLVLDQFFPKQKGYTKRVVVILENENDNDTVTDDLKEKLKN